ncbi:hypothetical protein EVAR_27137_1 [Eumeta japonica]|uniref:Uncharacterized protein n=1 Tax=Eumeta variegata TaxID=151549 RepID=A0A4C1W0D1_EUMVA|nr:hypothetical protein EVAR_27137_1 [Eumeta japonica]
MVTFRDDSATKTGRIAGASHRPSSRQKPARWALSRRSRRPRSEISLGNVRSDDDGAASDSAPDDQGHGDVKHSRLENELVK